MDNERWKKYRPNRFYAEFEKAVEQVETLKETRRIKRRNNRIAFVLITMVGTWLLYGLYH